VEAHRFRRDFLIFLSRGYGPIGPAGTLLPKGYSPLHDVHCAFARYFDVHEMQRFLGTDRCSTLAYLRGLKVVYPWCLKNTYLVLGSLPVLRLALLLLSVISGTCK
jgi:hypothetical protein